MKKLDGQQVRSVMRRWIISAAGVGTLVVYLSIVSLGDLRGPTTIDFLYRYFLAFGLYAVALISASRRATDQLRAVWFFAIAFRVALLLSSPTLSDDVYRYLWDGRVQNNGINPYAYRVDAPELAALSTPNRDRVNNAWMASPYLPVAQVYFAAAYRLAPETPDVFQAGAIIFDLTAGLFLTLTLRRAGLPAVNAIIYLWNPLVVVEVAHGAHVDALMTMLMMASLWLLARHCHAERSAVRRLEAEASRPAKARPFAPLRVTLPRLFSGARLTAGAIVLGLATLVKPIPALLVPVLMWRWDWRRTLVYGVVVVAGIAAYAGAGLGLGGELTGTGVFGATRIYLSQWNFNGGLFHWLEVALTGVQTPGAVPIELAGTGGNIARGIMLGALIVAVTAIGFRTRHLSDMQALFRFALPPLGAYVLFATTINPWYLLPLIAVLPFQADASVDRDAAPHPPAARASPEVKQRTSGEGECRSPLLATAVSSSGEGPGVRSAQRLLHLIAWLYFSAAVALSYLTYVDANPLNWGETYEVRRIEYLPLYALLCATAVVSLARWLTRRAAASTG